MSIDIAPGWIIFLATLGLICLALEIGFRLGRRHHRRGELKVEGAGAMIGATTGLVAFLLAFTFNGAAGRHDTRKTLIIEETNAIHEAWLRAGLLDDPYRTDARALLREYVEVRVKAGTGKMEITSALRRSDELQDRIWTLALAAGRNSPNSITTGLFIQSVGAVIELHLRRVTVGLRNRVPPPIWAALFLLTTIAMILMGSQFGLSGTRHLQIELAVAIAFSVTLFLIADLDRPGEGLIKPSQQALIELQSKLGVR